jgi:hypothetical protein
VRPVRLILDATAIRAYPHLDVGEPITQVEENGGAFTIALAAVVAARDTDQRMVWLLLGHPAHRPVDIPYSEWPALSAMTDTLGSFDLACCLWLSLAHDCDVLTSDPKPWTALGDNPPIVTF